jgi:hypothetical protein
MFFSEEKNQKTVTAHLPLLLINLLAYNDFSGQVPYLRTSAKK